MLTSYLLFNQISIAPQLIDIRSIFLTFIQIDELLMQSEVRKEMVERLNEKRNNIL